MNLLEGKKLDISIIILSDKYWKVLYNKEEHYKRATITNTNCTIISITADSVNSIDKIISTIK